MFGKRNKVKNAVSDTPVLLDDIVIGEKVSKAEIKKYTELLTRAQEQLTDRENKLSQLKEENRKRENNLPLMEQRIKQLEEKRNQEKRNCAAVFQQNQENLLSQIKKYQGKSKMHRIIACFLLIIMVAGGICYYQKAYVLISKQVETIVSEYERAYEDKLAEHEKSLQMILQEYQQSWDEELLSLQEEKEVLEDEIKEKLQTAY